MSTTVSELKAYLSTFDKVDKIQMLRYKNTGILKGYAKAVLATGEGMRRATHRPFHQIGGLKVGIMRWTDQGSYLKKKDQEGGRKVHVRMPDKVSETALLRYFSQYGVVEEISMRTYPGTNVSRNFCYITFQKVDVAALVIDQSPHLIANEYVYCELRLRPIKDHMELAKPHKQHQVIPGNYKDYYDRECYESRIPKYQEQVKHSINSDDKFPYNSSIYKGRRSDFQAAIFEVQRHANHVSSNQRTTPRACQSTCLRDCTQKYPESATLLLYLESIRLSTKGLNTATLEMLIVNQIAANIIAFAVFKWKTITKLIET